MREIAPGAICQNYYGGRVRRPDGSTSVSGAQATSPATGKRGCTEFLATKLVTVTRWGVKCLNAPQLVALLLTEVAVWVNRVNKRTLNAATSGNF
jgi:hypothetical protein